MNDLSNQAEDTMTEEQARHFERLLDATLRDTANPAAPAGLAARVVDRSIDRAETQAATPAALPAAPSTFWNNLRNHMQPARRNPGASLTRVSSNFKDTNMATPPTIPNPPVRTPAPAPTRAAAPLRPAAPIKDVQFAHFGVLDSGKQGKGSVLTAVVANTLLVICAIIIGAATHKAMTKPEGPITLVVPIKEKEPEPIKPVPKPKPLPKPPVMKPVEPKIVLDKVKLPDPPKPVIVKMPDVKPVVPVMPAPPKQVIAAAAPKPVAVSLARAASVVNNDAHPSPVALGHPDNPIALSSRPSASAVNLGNKGMPGMPASNTGGGPPAKSVSMGSGQPGGTLTGTGPKAVTGVKLGGITGGTGTTPGNGIGTRAVQLGQATPPPMPKPAEVAKAAGTTPKVTFKPEPVYTPEARAMHLEGTVQVSVKVLANGTVQVLGVTSGLGHGLDEAAIRSVQATRFQPALDADGHPTDWQGVVKVRFQLAG